jgi:hypothetical protein
LVEWELWDGRSSRARLKMRVKSRVKYAEESGAIIPEGA